MPPLKPPQPDVPEKVDPTHLTALQLTTVLNGPHRIGSRRLPPDQIEKMLPVALAALLSDEEAGPGNSHFDSERNMVWLTEEDARTLGTHVLWEVYSDWLMQKDWDPEKELAAKGMMTLDELAEYLPLPFEQMIWAKEIPAKHIVERQQALVTFQKERRAPLSLGLFVSILRGALESAGIDFDIAPEFLQLYEFGLWTDGSRTSGRPKTKYVLEVLCRALSRAQTQIRAAEKAPGGPEAARAAAEETRGGAASSGGTIETPKSDGRKDTAESAPTQPLAGNVFERSGDAWRIVYQGREKSYRDLIGFQYLALLLKDPGKPKTVSELFFGVPRPNRQRITAKQASELIAANGDEGDPDNPATLSPGTGDASQDPVYDKDGFAEAKEKYQELLADCDRARREGDERAEREAEEQLKAFMQTFKGDLNLAGKPRQMLRATEKQRKDIQKAINTALAHVERHDKALAIHLRKMVQTGGTCVYNGDAGWIVTL